MQSLHFFLSLSITLSCCVATKQTNQQCGCILCSRLDNEGKEKNIQDEVTLETSLFDGCQQHQERKWREKNERIDVAL